MLAGGGRTRDSQHKERVGRRRDGVSMEEKSRGALGQVMLRERLRYELAVWRRCVEQSDRRGALTGAQSCVSRFARLPRWWVYYRRDRAVRSQHRSVTLCSMLIILVPPPPASGRVVQGMECRRDRKRSHPYTQKQMES